MKSNEKYAEFMMSMSEYSDFSTRENFKLTVSALGVNSYTFESKFERASQLLIDLEVFEELGHAAGFILEFARALDSWRKVNKKYDEIDEIEEEVYYKLFATFWANHEEESAFQIVFKYWSPEVLAPLLYKILIQNLGS